MGKLIQNNFSGGEISPTLFGRSDLAAYYKGCAKAENFVISKEGTLRKRHGIASTGSGKASAFGKLVPYTYDRTNSGFIALTASGTTMTAQLYKKDLTTIGSALSISGFSGDIDDIQAKQIGDQLWITNGSFFKIITVTTTSTTDPMATATIAASDWTQASKPAQPTSITCTKSSSSYTGRTITYAAYVVKDGVMSDRKSVDVTWSKSWTAGSYIEVTVTWSVTDYDYILLAKKQGGSYGEVARWYPEDAESSATFHDDNISPGDAVYAQTNVLGDNFANPVCVDCFQQRKAFANATSDSTLTTEQSASSKCTTMTLANAPSEIVSAYNNSNCKDDCSTSGKTVTFPYASKWTVLYWSGTSSSETMYTQESEDGATSLTLSNTPTSLEKVTDNKNHASECSVIGTTVTMPANALWTIRYLHVANVNLPMTVWFSEVGNLDNFYADRPSADSDPFSPTIATTGPSFIRWIVAYQEMMVLFTDAGLFSVGFSQTQGFSASTCRISRFSNLAVSPTIQPVVTDAGVVFVGADNKTIYTASYDLQENMLKPVNRMVLTEHITRTAQVKALALQSAPDNVIWLVLTDGTIATFTFERNEEVYAWSTGSIDGATVEDVISLGSVTDTTSATTSAERTYGDLVFVVKKNDTYYLCRNATDWADSIGGTAQNVKATLTTLRPESQERTIAGQKKNVKDILLRLYNTGTIAVKPANGGDAMALVTAQTGTSGLFTGDVKVMPRGYIDEAGQITFVSDDQRQCEILNIVTTLEVEG